ncbi:MAG: hypothetical protein V1676_01920 [Candidatus Diapherotrites archaeon]
MPKKFTMWQLADYAKIKYYKTLMRIKRKKPLKYGYLDPINKENLMANRLIRLTRFLKKRYGTMKSADAINFNGQKIKASELAKKYLIEEVFRSMGPDMPNKREMVALRDALLAESLPGEEALKDKLPTEPLERLKKQLEAFGRAREEIISKTDIVDGKMERKDIADVRETDVVLNNIGNLHARCNTILMRRGINEV